MHFAMKICIQIFAPFLLILNFASPVNAGTKQDFIDAADPLVDALNKAIGKAKELLSTNLAGGAIFDALEELDNAKNEAVNSAIEKEKEEAIKNAKDVAALEMAIDANLIVMEVEKKEKAAKDAVQSAFDSAKDAVKNAVQTAMNGLVNAETNAKNGASQNDEAEIDAEKQIQEGKITTAESTAESELASLRTKAEEEVNGKCTAAMGEVGQAKSGAIDALREKLNEKNQKGAGGANPAPSNPIVEKAAENAEAKVERAEDKGEQRIRDAGKEAEKDAEAAQKKAEAKIEEVKEEALEMAKTNSNGAMKRMMEGEERAKEEFEGEIKMAKERIKKAKEEAGKSVKKVEKEGEASIDKTANQQVKAAKSAEKSSGTKPLVEATKNEGKGTLIKAETEAEDSLAKAFEEADNSFEDAAKNAREAVNRAANVALRAVIRVGGGGGGNNGGGGVASQAEVDKGEDMKVKPAKESNCRDEDTDNCLGNMNLCKNRAYFHVMSQKCKMTCGHCVPESFQCRDRYKPDCDMWGRAFCESKIYTKGMKLRQCAQSCGLCD